MSRPLPGDPIATVVAGRLRNYTCEHCREIKQTWVANQRWCPSPACQDAKRLRINRRERARVARAKRLKKLETKIGSHSTKCDPATETP